MSGPNPEFWRGRRVLLTGHTGFKGSWAALWLARLGAVTTEFALPPDASPALFDNARVASDVRSIIGDLRDPAAVNAAVETADPEIVLHFAAQPLVRRAIDDPVETFASNVIGTAHLLQALRAAPSLSRVLIVTSDKVYHNDNQGRAFVETDALGGEDPYSASKAATELLARAFANTYFSTLGVQLVTARGGNVIGGGDAARDRIVPDIVRAWSRGERPLLRMPEATRPWQHVLDCLAGYLMFVERMDRPISRALNFGPDPTNAVSVAALTRAMLEALGADPEFDVIASDGKSEMRALAIDARRAANELGWRNLLPGGDAIRWTADWHRRARLAEDPRAITLSQIEAYRSISERGL